MTTPKGMTQKRDLIAQLQGRGYALQVTDWPRRITWFKPSGEAMPNLPADPWHMERYLARGFTPDLPRVQEAVAETVSLQDTAVGEAEVVPEPAQPETVQQLPDHSCPKCGREMRAERCAWCKDE